MEIENAFMCHTCFSDVKKFENIYLVAISLCHGILEQQSSYLCRLSPLPHDEADMLCLFIALARDGFIVRRVAEIAENRDPLEVGSIVL